MKSDDDIYKRERNAFEVTTEPDPHEERRIRLSVTNNGWQWQTIGIPRECIPRVITSLEGVGHSEVQRRPGQEDICFAFEDTLREHQSDIALAKNLDAMVMAYMEAIEALRDARAQIDEEAVLYKQDSGQAVVDIIDEVLSKYPTIFDGPPSNTSGRFI